MMRPRTRSTMLSFFMTMLIAGAAVYILIKQKKIAGPEKGALFALNDVTTFTWQIGDRRFAYERTSAQAPWTPDVDSSRLNSKLETLAAMDLLPATAKPFPRDEKKQVHVELKLKSGETRVGFYQTNTFVWTSGPHEGQLSDLNADQAEIFEEGRFAFDALTWNWCLENPVHIAFEIEGQDIELDNDETEGWEVTRATSESQVGGGTWMPQWLEKSCPSRLRAWIDLSLADFGLDDGRLEVRNKLGAESEFAIRENAFQLAPEKAAVSPELYQALSEALEVP